MTTDLRVFQVNSIFNGGGVDNQTLELARGLVDVEVETALAVTANARMTPAAQAVSGLHVETLPSERLAFARGLSRLIRRLRPDIVHTHHGRDYWPTIIATWLAGTGAKVVVSRHLMGVVSKPSRALLLRAVDVVAVSQAVRGVLEATLRGPAGRLHQIYGGVDCTRFQPPAVGVAASAKAAHGWSADTVVFGVLGYFNPPRGKGQLEFLKAAEPVYRRYPQSRFLIVGAGGLQQPMQQMIEQAGMQEVCSIVPWQDDVRTVLAALDVLVYPAIEPEALGIALWEAMACGLPVIGSALGGIPEAFIDRQHGRLLPADNVGMLVEAMCGLAADATQRKLWGSTAHRYVLERFSTPIHAANMIALYRTILQRSR